LGDRVETHFVVSFLEHLKGPLVFESDNAYHAMTASAPPDAEIQLHIAIFIAEIKSTQRLLLRLSTVQNLIDAMKLFFSCGAARNRNRIDSVQSRDTNRGTGKDNVSRFSQTRQLTALIIWKCEGLMVENDQ
jgi:hypothetical protein